MLQKSLTTTNKADHYDFGHGGLLYLQDTGKIWYNTECYVRQERITVIKYI